MPTCLGHVEETLVLASGPGAGSSLSPRNASDGRVPHRLGNGHEWPLRPRSVERSPSSLALQLPGDAGRVSATETLSPGPMRQAQRSPASPHLSLPPGNVAELGSSPPLRGSLRQLVRLSPAGHPLQDTELAAQTTPEASLKRLVPLVDYLAAWKLLPNVSAWVLRTVERGYRIQFGAPPPFNGVFPTVVSPEQGLVMEQEVGTPVEEGGHRGGLSSRQGVRVLQPHSPPHFHEECGCCSDSAATPGHPHTQLHQRLVDFGSIGAHGGSTSRCCSRSYERAGVETERQEECAVSITENHLSRRCVGFDHDAGTFVTCSNRVDPHCSHESERRPVTHCKAVPATAGSDGSCVQHDPFGLLYMRPLQWWLRTKGFSPRGNPVHMIKVTRRCLRALDMWKKPWFLFQGPVLGAPCRRVTLATDAPLTGWGAVMSGHPARSLWSGRHLTWHINCLEMLAVFRALKHFLPDLIGRHVLVRTAEARGMDASPRGGEADLESFWPGLAPLELDAMVQTWPRLRLFAFPPIALLPGVLEREGSPLASGRHHSPPSPGVVEVMGVASEGAHLVASGLSTEVVETILQSRAPSTRKLYALKWKLFTSWCGDHQQDPVNCPVGTVLEFLQDRFSAGLAHSTLKVYVAAIAAYHALLGGSSRFRTQLEFPKGNVPGYVCNHGSPRERDAASRAILPASLQHLLLYLEAASCTHRTCF
ncbi:hypothetical protein M9458_052752 [Cirrhinus mrigala]|uniref:Core-binding (CB) domain-containing protein n=1 Tax=Cirrhinus mrigala TaxID=683832 RepID=A0ABD0MQR6_CIRMR